ncbi:tRNA (adenosine(37)-N6)-threonylcarbamoyltransferase complex ATPase subunit type 1 TsaE [Brunnivagina elsteri]|uniref:tRNA threonylcarbamoyladenosine biosynthesis protein TsaE n=1 Tax=Brunnivagina elsteri CCALA 953 TaxID=987040 RepID=A0A2A2TBF9_9CYAN|nr:tRNA (adenosine(37)-N6)-threonylcarbamoyltransferase complex ATPase subunit type 1 TsaE [Calothrix elsteri]PAX49856.1 tRNA (adenosine(37)-N6)-threonylcarbamoyltransferase complex ATPase subunit type 1 TsaE [Calothrix elsteri CCALA 953]
MKLVLADAIATQSLGFKFGELLPAGSVILLSGDLGAGKTTFVQGIGAGLGINDAIVSPTFTLINEYTEGRIPLYHLDLYRLQGNEVSELNLDSYWEGLEVKPGIVAIEWAERMPYKPDSYLEVGLMYANNSGNDGEIREVEIIPVNFIDIPDFFNKLAR